MGPVTVYRELTSGDSTITTWKNFPQRPVATGGPASVLQQGTAVTLPDTITFPVATAPGTQRTARLADLITQSDTKAFIVIRDDAVVYEGYFNGSSRDAIDTSFSIAKSVTSTLVGIAIDEGKIGSVNDPVINYLPELRGRGLDSMTIRDLLVMSSGIPFSMTSPFFGAYSDDSRSYYDPDLRHVLLNLRAGDEPVGAFFRYSDYLPLLEGLILERATGEHVAQYLQEKVWQPMGMEYPASYALDSTKDGLEKTNSDLEARAIDFARFGEMMLHQGQWNGKQIVSARWVSEATTPDPTDRRVWKTSPFWPQVGGYYKYHWWGLNNPDGTYDYFGLGKDGQVLYISPATHTVVVRLGAGEMWTWPMVIRAVVHALPADGAASPPQGPPAPSDQPARVALLPNRGSPAVR
jgi:CubicO group peptidase (beta-lactamase class C family)